MEKHDVSVKQIDEKHFIVIQFGEEEVKIPLSDNNPKLVKDAFNRIILQLKNGLFSLQFSGEGGDLYSQVTGEYVKQLNSEIREVWTEMSENGLIAPAGN